MSLLSEMETRILNSAHPFKALSDPARARLANWLTDCAAGQSQTRQEMIEADPGIRDALFADLEFVGAHAARVGLERQAFQAVCGERPGFTVELSDLEAARFVVSAKLTILCPDEP